MAEATPFSREVFEDACNIGPEVCQDPVMLAWAFFVRCRQSRAGTFKGFTQLSRNRLRRGINGNASEWLGAIGRLPNVHARLQPVVIENLPALKIIKREDGPGTLFYIDPPYLHETRVSTDAYAFEMSMDDHCQLLDLLGGIKGKFMLSGYKHAVYMDRMIRHVWTLHSFELPNNAARGREKRRMTECLWRNY